MTGHQMERLAVLYRLGEATEDRDWNSASAAHAYLLTLSIGDIPAHEQQTRAEGDGVHGLAQARRKAVD